MIFGCGQKAHWALLSGKVVCSKSVNQCPVSRLKNKTGVRHSHSIKTDYSYLKGRISWNKGKTKQDNTSVAAYAEKLSGRRRITDETRLSKTVYREQCEFNLIGVIEKVKGFDLLKENGMYHRINNPSGVVRDHRISIDFGWQHSIDPSIIGHPANCEFLLHLDNARKTNRLSIELSDLLTEIENF